MDRKAFTFDGSQFELDLFPGCPWDGRSVRGLTRVGKGLFLRQEPPGHEVERDLTQLSLWPAAGRPHGYQGPDPADGAPLLVGVNRNRVARRLRLRSQRALDEEE